MAHNLSHGSSREVSSMENGTHSSRNTPGDNLIQTVSRVYADVLKNKPKEYWDYKYCTSRFKKLVDFSIVRKLGTDEHSVIFLIHNNRTQEMYALKMFHLSSLIRLAREICIHRALNGVNNVIKFYDPIVTCPIHTGLLFEYISSVDFRQIYLELTELDIKYYMYELLKALNYCHSMGVMHRDVKPSNIVVDLKAKSLRLIGWEHAEFYHPGKRYDCDVTTLCYKGPELILGYEYYNYAIDMWSYGCILASMIFRKQPFFQQYAGLKQITGITNMLGTTDFLAYAQKYNIIIPLLIRKAIGSCDKKPWAEFITTSNAHLVDDHVLNLIQQLLQYDHMKRITAPEALMHPYFMNMETYNENVNRYGNMLNK